MAQNPDKQLFVDDFFIESLVDARRVLHQPRKLTVEQPLPIRLDQPWERDAQFQGVVYDEAAQRFRLYYRTWYQDRFLICALESTDGLTWERPELGLVQVDGSRANNVTDCPDGYLALFWDPHAQDDAQRWKRIDNKPTGMDAQGEPLWQAHHSADGCAWQPYPLGDYSRQKMLFNFGSPAETFGGTINPDAPYVYYSQRGSGRRTRVLGRRDSADALHWSGLRTVIDQDLQDPAGSEFYAAGFDVANRTVGGLHVLMLSVFQTDVREPYLIAGSERYWGPEGGSRALAARVDGFVETQLAVSRDTVAWQRFRQPFIARGEPGAWDWGTIYTGGPIHHVDQLYFYYTAKNLTHNGRGPQLWQDPYLTPGRWGKGVAVLRPDGYVSVESTAYAPGILTTHRFRQEEGGTLHVNVDAAAGELRYELLADTGEPIPGCTVADCDPIRRDALHAPLSWCGRAGWPPVSPERQASLPTVSLSEFYVKLRFYIAPGARLYALTVSPPEVTQWQVRVPGRLD